MRERLASFVQVQLLLFVLATASFVNFLLTSSGAPLSIPEGKKSFSRVDVFNTRGAEAPKNKQKTPTQVDGCFFFEVFVFFSTNILWVVLDFRSRETSPNAIKIYAEKRYGFSSFFLSNIFDMFFF